MSEVIEQTKQWLEQIVIGLNFCPFAKKEWLNNTIHYHQSSSIKIKLALEEVADQLSYLEQHKELETSLLIYSQGFKSFEQYLDLVDYSEQLLVNLGFEGVFQLASFHPDYCFAEQDIDDVTNYTNRSPYPMLHIIREESMEKVLNTYQNPEQIPDNNMA